MSNDHPAADALRWAGFGPEDNAPAPTPSTWLFFAPRPATDAERAAWLTKAKWLATQYFEAGWTPIIQADVDRAREVLFAHLEILPAGAPGNALPTAWAAHVDAACTAIRSAPYGAFVPPAVVEQMRHILLASSGVRVEQAKFFWENRPTSAAQALHDVMDERHRQMMVEGWTAKHDDEHGDGAMAIAGACYALASEPVFQLGRIDFSALWKWTGWATQWWKPKDKRCNLVRAAALLIAEIERMDRAAGKAGVGGPDHG